MQSHLQQQQQQQQPAPCVLTVTPHTDVAQAAQLAGQALLAQPGVASPSFVLCPERSHPAASSLNCCLRIVMSARSLVMRSSSLDLGFAPGATTYPTTSYDLPTLVLHTCAAPAEGRGGASRAQLFRLDSNTDFYLAGSSLFSLLHTGGSTAVELVFSPDCVLPALQALGITRLNLNNYNMDLLVFPENIHEGRAGPGGGDTGNQALGGGGGSGGSPQQQHRLRLLLVHQPLAGGGGGGSSSMVALQAPQYQQNPNVHTLYNTAFTLANLQGLSMAADPAGDRRLLAGQYGGGGGGGGASPYVHMQHGPPAPSHQLASSPASWPSAAYPHQGPAAGVGTHHYPPQPYGGGYGHAGSQQQQQVSRGSIGSSAATAAAHLSLLGHGGDTSPSPYELGWRAGQAAGSGSGSGSGFGVGRQGLGQQAASHAWATAGTLQHPPNQPSPQRPGSGSSGFHRQTARSGSGSGGLQQQPGGGGGSGVDASSSSSRKSDTVIVTEATLIKNAAGAIAKVLGRVTTLGHCALHTERKMQAPGGFAAVVSSAVKAIAVSRGYVANEGGGFEVACQPFLRRGHGHGGGGGSTEDSPLAHQHIMERKVSGAGRTYPFSVLLFPQDGACIAVLAHSDCQTLWGAPCLPLHRGACRVLLLHGG